jgi:hypothetical protein
MSPAAHRTTETTPDAVCVLCRRPGRPHRPVKALGTPAIPAHANCYLAARRACGAWWRGQRTRLPLHRHFTRSPR